MIKAVIFDFDGTLADRNKAICIAFSGESYRGTQRKVFQFKTMAEMALVPINK